MPLTVTHPFVSLAPNTAPATFVRAVNWNATHTVTGTLDPAQGAFTFVNVMATPFLATGNGVTDDTAAITAATAAAGASGAPVYFPPGTYRTTLQTFPAGVRTRWVGAGRGLTTIQVLGASGTAISGTWSHLTSEWYCEISAMTIDGNGGTGPLVLLNGNTLCVLRDVVFQNVIGTGLRIVSMYDSDFYNLYVQLCGDSTHPCVVLDSNGVGADECNANRFFDLHIEPGPVDAILLDLVGNATNAVSSNNFYALKTHGDPGTSNPNRPVIRVGPFTNNTHIYDPLIAFGRGTSQVEVAGSFNVFSAPFLGLGGLVPQVAFDLIGGTNVVRDAVFGSTTYSTTYFRNSGIGNKVFNPFIGGGPTPYTEAGGQFHIEYRDTAGFYNTYDTIGVKLAGVTTFATARIETGQGAVVAAANDLSLGFNGNVFHISGATQINAIAISYWQAGSVIRFIFDSNPLVKHNTAGGAGTAKLLLAGAVDFASTANDVLTLVYDGVSWFEVSRSVN